MENKYENPIQTKQKKNSNSRNFDPEKLSLRPTKKSHQI